MPVGRCPTAALLSMARLLCYLVVLLSAHTHSLILPSCQEASRRPRTATFCPQGTPSPPPANASQCTNPELCTTIAAPVPSPRCTTSTMHTRSVFDGIQHRPVGFTHPERCTRPATGWPFVILFGFGTLKKVSAPAALTFGLIKQQLLEQGIAFVETTQYAADSYNCRKCNPFESSNMSRTVASSCRSCLNDTVTDPAGSVRCEPLSQWFVCGNGRDDRDTVMLRALFDSIRNFSEWPLDLSRMAYMGNSVSGHMTSRAIQYGVELSDFPRPLAAVMVSSASYQCYTCPATRRAREPQDEFERCNWYQQGSVSNSGLNNLSGVAACGLPFPPFDTLPQNAKGVCPGSSLYPSGGDWWVPQPAAQQADDPLLTEEAWDSCQESFESHPPVLLVQPWEDSDAYWNAARNYFEVLARQRGGTGCFLTAGARVHGPVVGGNVETFNFLYSHLVSSTLTPTTAPTPTHHSSKNIAEIIGLSGAACAVVALLITVGIYSKRRKVALGSGDVNGEDPLLQELDK